MDIRWKWTLCVTYIGLLSASPLSQTTGDTTSYLKQATISETAGTVHVVANSPRPLAQTLDALQQKYGWVVDYEDPRFISKLDLVEVNDSGQLAHKPNRVSRLPGGGAFSVEFPASGVEEEKVLQLVVDSYNRSNNPGRFELRKSKSGAVVVVGTEARDARGQISRQRVLFDAPITLAPAQRTVSNTLKLICRVLSEHRGVAVSVGVSPRRLLDHTNAKVGGTNISARDLLLQALTATHRNFSWQLFYDPNSKGYFLNLHLIPPA